MITVLPATLTAAEARALVASINAKACEMGNLLPKNRRESPQLQLWG